jgi:hypothetical protein
MTEYDKIQKQLDVLLEKLNSPDVPEESKTRIKKLIEDLMMEANLILGKRGF